MEVVFGIQESPRELRIESDSSPAEVRDQVEKAFAEDVKILWMTDTRGKQLGIPVDQIAYVEIDAQPGERRVGFAPNVGEQP